MNNRPSTSILAFGERLTQNQSGRSLRWRLVLVAGIAAALVLGAVTYAGLYVLKRAMAGDEDARIINAATLSKQLVERVLSERTRQVDLIASEPSVIVAGAQGRRGLSPARAAEAVDPTARRNVQGDAVAAGGRSVQALPDRSAPQARYRRSDGHRRIRLQRGDHVAVIRLRAERRGVVADGMVQGRDDGAGDGGPGDAADRRRAVGSDSRSRREDRRRQGEVRSLVGRFGAGAGDDARCPAPRGSRRFRRQGDRELGPEHALQSLSRLSERRTRTKARRRSPTRATRCFSARRSRRPTAAVGV